MKELGPRSEDMQWHRGSAQGNKNIVSPYASSKVGKEEESTKKKSKIPLEKASLHQ
jgi:hypothetical protein